VSPFASGGPSLPVLLAEGLEVKVFWDLAKVSGLAGILAAGWLTYNFAVRPTIQDLGQLMKLPELIASKAKDILRLAKHGSLRKRVKLHLLEETLEGVPVPKGEIVADQIFQGLGNARFFVYNAEVTTVKVLRKRRIWAVVHWRVDAELKQKLRALLNLSYRDSRFNLPALNKLAAGIVTNTAGFGILQTIWEIIPFSWLVDYFVNIQKFLEYVERPDGLDATVWLMRNEQFTVHPDSVVETFEYIPEWKPYNANTIPRPDSKYFEQRVKVLKPGHVEILSRQEWEEDTGVLLRDYLFSPKQWANLTALLGLMRRTKNLPSTPEKQQ
jgi:hypothetical protein